MVTTYPKTTKKTELTYATCRSCSWTGDAKRNVLNEVQTHILREHLSEAIERFPACNPYDAAYYYATIVGRTISIKKWILDDAVWNEIFDLEEAREKRDADEEE